MKMKLRKEKFGFFLMKLIHVILWDYLQKLCAKIAYMEIL